MTDEVTRLLAERYKLWQKVKPSTSTRWTLVAFERADAAYRQACRRADVPYEKDFDTLP